MKVQTLSDKILLVIRFQLITLIRLKIIIGANLTVQNPIHILNANLELFQLKCTTFNSQFLSTLATPAVLRV